MGQELLQLTLTSSEPQAACVIWTWERDTAGSLEMLDPATKKQVEGCHSWRRTHSPWDMAAGGQLKAWQKVSVTCAKLPQQHEQLPKTLLREAMDMRWFCAQA